MLEFGCHDSLDNVREHASRGGVTLFFFRKEVAHMLKVWLTADGCAYLRQVATARLSIGANCLIRTGDTLGAEPIKCVLSRRKKCLASGDTHPVTPSHQHQATCTRNLQTSCN